MSNRTSFGTKAENLSFLSKRLKKSRIADLYFFSFKEWLESPDTVMQAIAHQFPSGQVIIRSSSRSEDTGAASMAGAFLSFLHLEATDRPALASAISRIFASYNSSDESHQVLVQPMLQDLELVGVVLTRDHQTGSPYYIFNYDDESGRTDTVTGGTNACKSVLVGRDTPRDWVRSPRIVRLLESVEEVEDILKSDALDIEIALDKSNDVWILQARPIATERNWDPEVHRNVTTVLGAVDALIERRTPPSPFLLGERTVFGEMSDWNPAEMIGVRAAPLAFSLYRNLITKSTWREAREIMGYRNPYGEELMVSFANRPFIDIRNSFNSFLPAATPPEIGEKLVNAWVSLLVERPELHDKIEFDVALTCFAPGHDALLEDRFPGLLTREEAATWRKDLLELTNNCLTGNLIGSLDWCEATSGALERIQNSSSLEKLCNSSTPNYPKLIAGLVDQCRRYGTLPFSVAARHGFIAEIILRQLLAQGALAEDEVLQFKRSIKTVAGDVTAKLSDVHQGDLSQEEFLRDFGHLRAGSYDICSPRYDRMEELFELTPDTPLTSHANQFEFPAKSQANVDKLLTKNGLALSANAFFSYYERAVQAREKLKMVFSRHLSDLLELVARWGEIYSLDRHEMAFLTLEDIETLTISGTPKTSFTSEFLLNRIADGKASTNRNNGTRLSYLVSDKRDLHIVPLQRSRPNFVTRQKIAADPLFLEARKGVDHALSGKIVCIENADPGFDWIFSCGIAGVITMYGGANSHMAIRCAEFNLPAAIGCGIQMFGRLKQAVKIELDCASETIRPLNG